VAKTKKKKGWMRSNVQKGNTENMVTMKGS